MTEELEQFESDLKKGNFPKKIVQEMKEKLEKELGEKEEHSSTNTIETKEENESMPLRFYSDQAMNHEIVQTERGFNLGIGENGYFYFYAYNSSSTGTVLNLCFQFADIELLTLEVPEVIGPNELGRIKLRLKSKRGLNTEARVSCSVVYLPPSEVTRFRDGQK